MVNVRNELTSFVEDVEGEVFISGREDVLLVVMERVLRLKIIIGDKEIFIETERGSLY